MISLEATLLQEMLGGKSWPISFAGRDCEVLLFG